MKSKIIKEQSFEANSTVCDYSRLFLYQDNLINKVLKTVENSEKYNTYSDIENLVEETMNDDIADLITSYKLTDDKNGSEELKNLINTSVDKETVISYVLMHKEKNKNGLLEDISSQGHLNTDIGLL